MPAAWRYFWGYRASAHTLCRVHMSERRHSKGKRFWERTGDMRHFGFSQRSVSRLRSCGMWGRMVWYRWTKPSEIRSSNTLCIIFERRLVRISAGTMNIMTEVSVVFFSVPPGRIQCSTSNHVTATFFHISRITKHHCTSRNVVSRSGDVVK